MLACCGLLTVQDLSAQAVTQFSGTTTVGQSSAAITVPITLTSTAQTYAATAVTQGVENLDFSIMSETCTADEPSPPVGTVCTATVVFTPKYPGLRSGAVLVKSSDGTTLLGSTLISGVGTGSLAVLDPGVINTVAGNQFWTYSPGNEGYPASSSSLYLPYGVVADPSGKVYISDTLNGRVRMVDTSGKIWTIAGDGTFGYSGDGGAATSAEVNEPSGLAIDGAGNIYFADSGNDVVRRIDRVSGVITTVAGTPGNAGFSGDGSAATAAKLSSPEGIAFDAEGDLFIADSGNEVIRKVDATNGTISTVAGEPGEAAYNGEGTATTHMLNLPWSVAVGPDGALYIADTGNSRIRRVIGGVISTVAGSNVQSYGGDGHPAIQAALNQPYGIALDPAGDLYIADSGNHCIRKVSPGSGVSNGTATIQTIIGTPGNGNYGGDGKAANLAQVNGPYELYFAQNGDFYFADTHNNRVREVVATPFTMPAFHDTKATKLSDDVQTENVDSDGNADLQLNAPALNNAALDSNTTTCSFTQPTTQGTACTVGVQFAPSIAQQDLQGTVTMGSDAANAPEVIDISGNGLDVNPTTVTVTSGENPSVVGDNVLFTAAVTNNNAGALTGTVTFTDGATTLCSNVNLNGGSASCPGSFSVVGTHTIAASYSGDANNEAMSGTVAETVLQRTTVSLSLTPLEATVGSTLQMSVTVTAPGATPTGTVTLYYDSTAFLGPTAIQPGGMGVYTNVIPPGHHNVWVSYSGDASNAAGTSNQVAVVIDQAATTTTLATSQANPTVGQSVTLTATVSGSQGFTPTGSVTFTDNGMAMAGSPVTISGSETATLTVSSLTPGNHAITATYGGDTDDAVSWSTPAVVAQVAQIATLTTVTADANPLSAGATLHLTATVALAQGAAADGALTGQVTFTGNGTALNTPISIDASGHATLAVSSMAIGTHAIVATYNGAANYATSSSSALSEQVQQTATAVALTGSATSVLAGKPVSFTASVTSSTGVPTGSMTFSDGAAVLGTVNLSGQNAATLTISSLTVGSHSITAAYNGDANYSGASSSAVAETVSLAQPMVTLSGPSNAVEVGTAVVLTGSVTGPGVTPTGTLTLLDIGTIVGTQAVAASGRFTFSTSSLPLGTRSLSVAYSGDSGNAAVSSATIAVIIQLAPTATALSASSNPGTVGQPVTLSASVVSDSPGVSGTVTFLDGAATLGTASVGTSGNASLLVPALGFGVHSVSASYSGDAAHAASSSAAVSERMTEPATATLNSSGNPAIAGMDVVFTATVAANGGQTPTGVIVFSDGGVALGSAALNATGTAVLHTSSLTVGQHSVTANYAGDANVAPTSATLTETIVSATTQVSVSSSAVLVTYNTAVSLTATVTSDGTPPTGQVTFVDNGAAIGSVGVSAEGAAALPLATLAPGNHSVVAQYAGDARNAAANSSALSIVVKQATSLLVTSSANPTLTVSQITLTAKLANSGAAVATGTVTFADGGHTLGTASLDANGAGSLTVSSLPAGSHSITASYAGDGEDFSSNSPVWLEVVNLRPSVTTLSASHTDASNPQEVTLIAVVQASGPDAASGTVSFSSGSVQIGEAKLDATGVATLTILLDESSNAENIVAQYSGDTVYAASSSAAASVQAGPATQFTLSIDPAAISVVTKQHTTVTLSLNSIAGFNDTIQLGCLGLPFAATCTFSAPQTKLSADGSTNVQLTIDTGDPLGMGAQSSAKLRGSGGGVLLCGVPTLLLIGVLRRKRKLACAWVSLACMAMMISGCSGLQSASTAPGTYTFKVTASGVGSGATQSQVLTLTVTQ